MTNYLDSGAVDEYLRQIRKSRATRACYPCRRRKVKCNFERPCEHCLDRDHPGLCTDQPTRGKQHRGRDKRVPAHTRAQCPPPSNQQRFLEETSDAPKTVGANTHVAGLSPVPRRMSLLSGISNNGLIQLDEATGGMLFTGTHSCPSFAKVILEKASPCNTENIISNDEMIPMFGLSSSNVTYPFVSLWPSGGTIDYLKNALPADATCMRYYRLYKIMIHPVLPIVRDIAHFESDLCDLLEAREMENSGQGIRNDTTVYGKDIEWIGLLFAMLAAGCQNSEMPQDERELSSRVLVCFSFECLRIINFFLCPSIEVIQSLLIIGTVTQNSLNPGVSWAIFGVTIRLAQTLGLDHIVQSPDNDSQIDYKSYIWQAVAWHDSILCMAYDRQPSVTFIPPSSLPDSTRSSYRDCRNALCDITLEIVRRKISSMEQKAWVTATSRIGKQIDGVLSSCEDHLSDMNACNSVQDRVEHLSLRLHLAFVRSRLYRPAFILRGIDEDLQQSLMQSCIQDFKTTVSAFIDMHRLSTIASTAWEYLHRASSSALLLGIIGISTAIAGSRELLHSFIKSLSNRLIITEDEAETVTALGSTITVLKRLLARQCEYPASV